VKLVILKIALFFVEKDFLFHKPCDVKMFGCYNTNMYICNRLPKIQIINDKYERN